MKSEILDPFKPAYRKSIDFLKKHETAVAYVVLIAIFLFAFYVRSFDITGPYLNADDPYRGYRIIDYAINNNLMIPSNDTLINYPQGANMYHDYILWYYIPAFFGLIFKMFGAADPSLLATKFYPAFFGALMSVAGYLIVKEVTGSKKAGLLGALIMAFSQSVIARTVSTSAIKEPLGGFFMLLSAFFFIKSLRKFSWTNSILSGLILVVSAYSWGGTNAYAFMLAGFAFFAVLFNLLKKEFTYTYLATFASYYIVGRFIKLLLGNSPFPEPTNIYILVNMVASVVILGIILADKYKMIPHKYQKYRGTYVIAAGAVLVLAAYLVYSPFSTYVDNWIEKVRAPLARGDVVSSTVAYFRQASLQEVIQQINGGTVYKWFNSGMSIWGIFTFALVGLGSLAYSVFKRVDVKVSLFMAVWFVSWIGLGIGAVRMIYLSAVISAVLAAIGMYYLVRAVYVKLGSKSGYYSYLKYAILAFIGLLLFAQVHSAYVVGKQIGPSMSGNWEAALVWIKENSQPDDVVLSWWDYGYIIEWYANRATYVDPGHTGGPGKDLEVAKFFTSTNETEYLDWLKSLNVEYVVHDASMVGKYSAVSTIASEGKYTDQFIVLPVQESRCIEQGANDTCKRGVIQYYNNPQSQVWAVQSESGLSAYYVQNNQLTNISSICLPDGSKITQSGGLDTCVMFASDGAVLMGLRCTNGGCGFVDISETMFAEMWFFNARDLEHFELVHSNGEVKVFKVKY